jgi:hypothetical protein
MLVKSITQKGARTESKLDKTFQRPSPMKTIRIAIFKNLSQRICISYTARFPYDIRCEVSDNE